MMKCEIPIVNVDGSIAPGGRPLIQRLKQEAVAGMVCVNAYRGIGIYGSEAFYTLADGTVLHEVNDVTSDGATHHCLMQVVRVRGPAVGVFQFLHQMADRWWSAGWF
ncbi:MAG: hypothetical protein AB1791_09720 [Chloroflexota bacterium]